MDTSTTTLHINSILKISLDIISGDSNSWIFHSSDDVENLYILPLEILLIQIGNVNFALCTNKITRI